MDADQSSEPAEFETKNAEFETKNAELRAKNAKLAEKNAELEAKVAELEAKLQKLTELVGRNSRNSHLPPSSDGPGASKKHKSKSKQKKKRKRGGQKGHRGNHRQLLPLERVDEVVDVFPEVCLGCASSLPQLVDDDARRHQLVDLVHGSARVTEFRRHEVRCPCGHRTRVSFHDAKIPASCFGPGLVATVALLTGVYHLSRRQAQRLLAELFEVEVSLGALSAMEARASAALEPAVAEAQREVERAAVKHTDATSWARAGVLMSLWVIASAMVTVYRILDDGRRETIEPIYGEVHEGILVSDRALKTFPEQLPIVGATHGTPRTSSGTPQKPMHWQPNEPSMMSSSVGMVDSRAVAPAGVALVAEPRSSVGRSARTGSVAVTGHSLATTVFAACTDKSRAVPSVGSVSQVCQQELPTTEHQIYHGQSVRSIINGVTSSHFPPVERIRPAVARRARADLTACSLLDPMSSSP